MFKISKLFGFEASHHLDGLPPGHQCARVHGHSYRVKVTLTRETLDDTGFVLDYGALKPFGDWLAATFDHQDLNRVLGPTLGQPSAERLAMILYANLLTLVHLPDGATATVAVSETAKTWAEYRP